VVHEAERRVQPVGRERRARRGDRQLVRQGEGVEGGRNGIGGRGGGAGRRSRGGRRGGLPRGRRCRAGGGARSGLRGRFRLVGAGGGVVEDAIAASDVERLDAVAEAVEHGRHAAAVELDGVGADGETPRGVDAGESLVEGERSVGGGGEGGRGRSEERRVGREGGGEVWARACRREDG